MVSGVSSPSPVNQAYQVQVNHQPPAKPATNQPTDNTPQDDKVELSGAAKGTSGDVDHDGDSH
jgi:hypothetical protein